MFPIYKLLLGKICLYPVTAQQAFSGMDTLSVNHVRNILPVYYTGQNIRRVFLQNKKTSHEESAILHMHDGNTFFSFSASLLEERLFEGIFLSS